MRVDATLRDDIFVCRLEPGACMVRHMLAKRLAVCPVPVSELLLRTVVRRWVVVSSTAPG